MKYIVPEMDIVRIDDVYEIVTMSPGGEVIGPIEKPGEPSTDF